MFQRDYIARQVRQFTEALAGVLLRRQNREYDAALAGIREAGEQFFGLDPGQVHRLSDEDLTAGLQGDDGFNADAALFLAELLRLQGDLVHLTGGEEALAAASYERALRLYLDVCARAPAFRSPDTLARIDAVCRVADPLTTPTLARLFAHYEAVGRYDRAEDTLFRLAERAPAEWYEEGVAFFERLRGVSFTRLRRGGLPMKEVEEGLRTFRRRFAPDGLSPTGGP